MRAPQTVEPDGLRSVERAVGIEPTWYGLENRRLPRQPDPQFRSAHVHRAYDDDRGPRHDHEHDPAMGPVHIDHSEGACVVQVMNGLWGQAAFAHGPVQPHIGMGVVTDGRTGSVYRSRPMASGSAVHWQSLTVGACTF